MRKRQGFTLVEMLVAMALTMFIMVILAEAFSTGLDVFSQLKAIGDMEEKLRAAGTALRADLAADPFEGKRRLSDLDIYTNRPRQGFVRIYVNDTLTATTKEGFDPGPVGVNPGVASFRSGNFAVTTGGVTTVYGAYILHMAVKKRGNGRQDFFAATIPTLPVPLWPSPLFPDPAKPLDKTNFFNQAGDARLQDLTNTYSSQWAEKAYWLKMTGTTTEPNNPGASLTALTSDGLAPMPLYALNLTQRVIVPDNTYLNYGTTLPPPAPLVPVPYTLVTRSAYGQMSFLPNANNNPPTLYFNNPEDVTAPGNRAFDPTSPEKPLAAGGAPQAALGTTLLMSNVVSFHVRALRTTAPTVPTTPTSQRNFPDLTATDYFNVAYLPITPTRPAVIPGFDTSTSGTIANDTNVRNGGLPAFYSAIAVTLRVWDQKTQQTRQITIVQDM